MSKSGKRPRQRTPAANVIEILLVNMGWLFLCGSLSFLCFSFAKWKFDEPREVVVERPVDVIRTVEKPVEVIRWKEKIVERPVEVVRIVTKEVEKPSSEQDAQIQDLTAAFGDSVEKLIELQSRYNRDVLDPGKDDRAELAALRKENKKLRAGLNDVGMTVRKFLLHYDPRRYSGSGSRDVRQRTRQLANMIDEATGGNCLNAIPSRYRTR